MNKVEIALSNNIRRFRHEFGWTQTRLAAELGCSPVSVNRWENGLAYPDSESLIKIADTFNVEPSDMISDNRGIKDKKIHLRQAIKMINELVEKELKEAK